MPTTIYPRRIIVGNEPKGFGVTTIISPLGNSFQSHIYQGAIYNGPYGYKGPQYYELGEMPEGKDTVIGLLSDKIQIEEPKETNFYYVHNNITNRTLVLYKGKTNFGSKSALTTAFLSWMRWDMKIHKFGLEDYKELLDKKVIEIRILK